MSNRFLISNLIFRNCKGSRSNTSHIINSKTLVVEDTIAIKPLPLCVWYFWDVCVAAISAALGIIGQFYEHVPQQINLK